MRHASDKLIAVGRTNPRIDLITDKPVSHLTIYRSKGLLAHLLKRKHYVAARYLDCLQDILQAPDYVGFVKGQIELVKQFKDNIFISIKLDVKQNHYYIATMFDVKQSKIEVYYKKGRWRKLDDIVIKM